MAALDGTIYLVEINSRKILWSFSSGQSIYSSYQTLPSQGSDNNNNSEPDDFFIDCGDDWGLYVHGPGQKKVVRYVHAAFIFGECICVLCPCWNKETVSHVQTFSDSSVKFIMEK